MSCAGDEACGRQKIWTPKQRAKATKTSQAVCAAICASTERRCTNAAKYFWPQAAMVIKLKACCTLCCVHRDVAVSKMKEAAPRIGAKLLSVALGSQMTYDEYLSFTNWNLDTTLLGESEDVSDIVSQVTENVSSLVFQ